MKNIGFFLLFLFFNSFYMFSISSFSQGKELFEKNNIEEAILYLEEALVTKPTKDVYKYLAESYNILGLHEDEILVLEEAIDNDVGENSYFYFKLGNAYHLAGDYKSALESYSEVISINNGFVTETFLNIGNVSVELKLYPSAIDNYTKYLELDPNSVQKRKIIKMVLLLKKLYKEELTKIEEDNALNEALLAKQALEQKTLDESRLLSTTFNQKLEDEREARARELQEQRLLYDTEQQSFTKDKSQFEIDEAKVLNPPDPEIEAQRKLLQQREEELLQREKNIAEAQEALKQAELALEESKQKVPEKTEAELLAEKQAKELEEFNKNKLAEEQRQQALMNDILQSLEKIGQNAKGINASNEGAFGELEGSGIDE